MANCNEAEEYPKDFNSGYDSRFTGEYILKLQERCKDLEGKRDQERTKIADLEKRLQQLEQKIANKLPF